MLLLHGLEGSSEAHYMAGMAEKAWARGFNVVRLNQRNCGGTEHLSRGLYHSGLTHDPRFVLAELRDTEGLTRFGVAGYSLGGNLTMKLAGEFGTGEMPEVKAFGAVSPVLELEACVRAIERRANRLYEWNFCRNLQSRMRRKARHFPEAFELDGLWKIWSIRAFDERYTAPHHGFDGASDYYHRASAMRVIDRVARPALVLTRGRRPVRAAGDLRRRGAAPEPAHHDGRDPARRPLRVRRAGQRLRRLLRRAHGGRFPRPPPLGQRRAPAVRRSLLTRRRRFGVSCADPANAGPVRALTGLCRPLSPGRLL